jgi:hypothetical protein
VGIGRLRRYSPKGRPFDIGIELTLSIEGSPYEYGFILGSERRNEYRIKREFCKKDGLVLYELAGGLTIEGSALKNIPKQNKNLTLPLTVILMYPYSIIF